MLQDFIIVVKITDLRLSFREVFSPLFASKASDFVDLRAAEDGGIGGWSERSRIGEGR